MELIFNKLKGGRINTFIAFALLGMLITGMFFVLNFVNANNPVCGNGELESGEACDDGNLICGDGCSDSCQIEGLVLCGNGLLDAGEQCDAGLENGVVCQTNYGGSCSYCSNVCQTIEVVGPYCGDGVANGTEECDDGNFISGDGCSAACQDEESGLCAVDLDAVIIMDRSGSMGEDIPPRLAQAKIAADGFLDKLRSSDQSALVSFSTSANLDKQLSNDHGLTKNFINSLSANGSTNIGDAIKLANEENNSSRSNPSALKIEILLTDGRANKPNGTGSGENSADVAYAGAKAAEAASLGIKIFSVGLGSDVNQTMLANIALVTGGKYYLSPTASDLESIFNEIAFEACQYGSIAGCKYSDTNNDGNIAGDEKLAGWKIKLSGPAAEEKLTDETGCYVFTGLKPGIYTVSEDANQSVNFIQTFPINPSNYTIHLTKGENKTGMDFANYLPICGNSTKDAGEDCDEGADNGELCTAPYGGTCQYCNMQCKLITVGDGSCGDGKIDASYEQCDEGGSNGVICQPNYGVNCSYCSNVCQHTVISGPYCGDNIKNGPEQCDGIDGVSPNYRCTANCILEAIAYCGDGIINGAEECDDSNNIDGDGCSQQCLIDLGKIKICKHEDADGSLSTVNDQAVVSLWPFTISSIISPSTLATTTAAITGSDGCAVINNLPVGDYEIIEGAKDGWFAISPISGKATTTVLANKESLKNFYNTRYAIISGYKYKDDDGLASTTSDRGPLSGWIINLFSSISTSTPMATTTTNSEGFYEFKNLLPGNYLLTENIIDGWIQMEAPTSTIFILSGNLKGNNNFINRVASYCGDGTKQSPNERGVNEECDASDGVGNGQRCTLQCKLETIVVPAVSGGGGGGGGGGILIIPKPIVLGVEGKPLLTIEKSVNLEFANPGDKAMYSVKITNSGNLTAFGVTLKDVLPEGLVFSGDNKKEKNIDLGDIKAGETKIIEYEVLVNKTVKAGFYPNMAKAKALNHGEIIDSVDLEVREVKVLGEELVPTGFNINEFLALIGILMAISATIIYSKKKLINLGMKECL
jgi:uncharacterized repeat protein (TIGR01451 family)